MFFAREESNKFTQKWSFLHRIRFCEWFEKLRERLLPGPETETLSFLCECDIKDQTRALDMWGLYATVSYIPGSFLSRDEKFTSKHQPKTSTKREWGQELSMAASILHSHHSTPCLLVCRNLGVSCMDSTTSALCRFTPQFPSLDSEHLCRKELKRLSLLQFFQWIQESVSSVFSWRHYFHIMPCPSGGRSN